MTRERRVITLDNIDSKDIEESPSRNDSIENVINTLAMQVRNVYCICVREMTGKEGYGKEPMPYWDGGVNKHGTRRQPIWPKVAENILRLNADPLEFIRAQFSTLNNPTQFPKPNMLYNDDAVYRWQVYRDSALRNLRQRVASELNQIRIESMPLVVNMKWSQQKAITYVLRSRSCSVSPLVRYCVCVSEGLDSLAQVFRSHAILQYMFQMADYDVLLGDKVPALLRTDATELKQRLVGP